MRNTKHGSGLGRWRWVVERTFAWLNQFRRLRLRYEKRPDMHLAFLTLARAGQPDDIASVVTFLASEDAKWLTGELIIASGDLRFPRFRGPPPTAM
jgi:NAD(P)-dependent dehydrogenase (short-subunit alcohol dehydrogenase family)